MKKLIFIIAIALNFGVVFGQHDKIKALKTAHITTELNLTSSEAEKFWPIYNASQEKTQQLRRQLRELHKKNNAELNTISEQEAINILNTIIDLDDTMHREKQALTQKLKKVLSAKKIILLQKAEHQFNRKLIKKFRDRRSQSNRHSPHKGQ